MVLLNLTEALQAQFKDLSLNDFPCGPGPWRSSVTWRSDLLDSSSFADKADLYTVECLKDIAGVDPFVRDADWSPEVKHLKEFAIESADCVTFSRVYPVLKSVRLIDKKICAVDPGLLKLENLTELSLAANFITTVSAEYLPRHLKVLELYGNKIADPSCLCTKPVELRHLGLGDNGISDVRCFATHCLWKTLLSLDLSFNNLRDMKSVLDALRVISSVRSINLQGNPMSLVLGYRGCVIDSLSNLTILDGARISTEERQLFREMSKTKAIYLNNFVMAIKVGAVEGLEKPFEVENDPNEVFPRMETKYHIEIDYVNGCRTLELSEMPPVKDAGMHEDQVITKPSGRPFLKTAELHWSEGALNFVCDKCLIASDTEDGRDLLLQGVGVRLVEDRILVSNVPASDEPDSAAQLAIERLKTLCVGGNGMPSVKSRALPVKVNKEEKPKLKGKAKEKHESELFELFRLQATVASATLACRSLMEEPGFTLREKLLTTHSRTQLPIAESLRIEKLSDVVGPLVGEETRKKSKAGSQGASDATLRPSTSQPKASATTLKGSRKGKPVKVNVDAPVNPPSVIPDAEKECPSKPVTIDISLQLFSWKSTEESSRWMHMLKL